MNYQRIKALQKAYGVTGTQDTINNGLCWKMEGSVGRFAMDTLESGICMLPKKPKMDAYGNIVPSRDVLKAGTKGTYATCKAFWEKVEDGDWDAIEYLEETFLIEDM